jgi:hypothetical protein
MPGRGCRFVETVTAADDAVTATGTTAAALRSVHRALLPELLSGEHSVPPEYDVLLETA